MKKSFSIPLIVIVFLFAVIVNAIATDGKHESKIFQLQQEISMLELKIEALNESVYSKADKNDLKAILKRTDAIDINMKEVTERVNGWQGIWDNFFEPHQKAYMKRK